MNTPEPNENMDTWGVFTFQCPDCGRIFDTRRGYSVHYAKLHALRDTPPFNYCSPDNIWGCGDCPECREHFDNSEDYENHFQEEHLSVEQDFRVS